METDRAGGWWVWTWADGGDGGVMTVDDNLVNSFCYYLLLPVCTEKKEKRRKERKREKEEEEKEKYIHALLHTMKSRATMKERKTP